MKLFLAHKKLLCYSLFIFLFLAGKAFAFCPPSSLNAFSLLVACGDGKCEKITSTGYVYINQSLIFWDKVALPLDIVPDYEATISQTMLNLDEKIKNEKGVFDIIGSYPETINSSMKLLVITRNKVSDDIDQATINQEKEKYQSRQQIAKNMGLYVTAGRTLLPVALLLFLCIALPFTLFKRYQARKQLSPNQIEIAKHYANTKKNIAQLLLFLTPPVIYVLLGLISKTHMAIFPEIDFTTLVLRAVIVVITTLGVPALQIMLVRNIYLKLIRAGLTRKYAFYRPTSTLMIIWAFMVLWMYIQPLSSGGVC